MRSILVTSALPYANGDIHLGHLVEYLQTDMWVRYLRLRGHDCIYLCADDAHGTPIMLRARSEGIDPADLVAEMKTRHERDFADFHIQFDQFHTTHSDENRECVNRIYGRLRDGGHLSRRTIEQAYDPKEGMFLPDRFIKGTCPKCGAEDQYGDSCESCGATYSPTDLVDAVSVISGASPIRKGSEHVFFDLGAFEGMLRDYVGSGRLQDSVSNKLLEWFDAGLQDWDISRDAPYWGFEIPDMPGKYFYVWLDAPVGYQATHLRWSREHQDDARPLTDFDRVWAPDSDVEVFHFIGKDVSYFHNLFWPAMLHGAGYRTPTAVFVHGFLTVDGRKMSKSRGTFINARTYLEHLPAQALRYYYAAKLGSGVDDLDLALDDFVFRVNAELVNKVINIASRCGSMLNKRYESKLSDTLDDPELYATAVAARAEFGELFEAREFAKAIRVVAGLADEANRYIDTRAPWALAKNPETFEEGRAVCTQGLNQFRVLMTLLSPVVPEIAERAFAFLRSPLSWDALETPLLAETIEQYEALMFRLDRKKVTALIEANQPAKAEPPKKKAKKKKKAEAPPPAEIDIDQFLAVDLRVARVVSASHVEGADRLVQVTVDLGGEQRNIFAGIKDAYPPESLVGRHVVVVANLKPRKMRFGVSEGMILAAADGRPYIITADEGASPGLRVR